MKFHLDNFATTLLYILAKVAELVDAHDSNSCSFRSEGSTPSFGTKRYLGFLDVFICVYCGMGLL